MPIIGWMLGIKQQNLAERGYRMSKTIPLTRDYVTVVDNDDYEWLNQYKWYSACGRGGLIYAARNIRRNGKRTMEFMHRIIINPAENMEVDHINGNGIDNRRHNLRVCTHSQNAQNQRPQKRNLSSKYKGVYWRKRRKCWRAQIQNNGKKMYLGHFDNEEAAAHAYNEAAIRLFGEFAQLNIKGEGQDGQIQTL